MSLKHQVKVHVGLRALDIYPGGPIFISLRSTISQKPMYDFLYQIIV